MRGDRLGAVVIGRIASILCEITCMICTLFIARNTCMCERIIRNLRQRTGSTVVRTLPYRYPCVPVPLCSMSCSKWWEVLDNGCIVHRSGTYAIDSSSSLALQLALTLALEGCCNTLVWIPYVTCTCRGRNGEIKVANIQYGFTKSRTKKKQNSIQCQRYEGGGRGRL